ncbi:MAG: phosphoribulokinase [Gammaproteobacteria bacterium]
MSHEHPIIAVTGSSGAGTTNVKTAFENICYREGIKPAIMEGDSFHRYDRAEMQSMVSAAQEEGKTITHFGPEGNLFEELESVFQEYSKKGTGRRRWYIHNEEEAYHHKLPPGSISDWEALPKDSDVLFYEGLHGGLVSDKVNVAKYVDLLVGVVPIINLEWIQKIQRDRLERGHSVEAATQAILGRMHDYVHYIVPQFSRTDINFQRVPTVDTSDPFGEREVPSNDQSFSVVHARNHKKLEVNFPYLLSMLDGSFMSTPDTIVVPAGKKTLAMELIFTPIAEKLMSERRKTR